MRQELQRYLSMNDMTANRLSAAVNIGQPTLSRFLSGRTKSVTPSIAKALRYADIVPSKTINCISQGVDNAILRAALERNWDGTAEGAESLAVLIDTMGSLLRSMRLGSTKKRQ